MGVDLLKKIREKLFERDMTISDLAKKLNISRPFLSQVLCGTLPMTERTEYKLKKWIDVKSKDLDV